jgi:lysyl-tRNA synthetase class I
MKRDHTMLELRCVCGHVAEVPEDRLAGICPRCKREWRVEWSGKHPIAPRPAQAHIR